ncbi:flagellar basal body P-ring formation chaperone FlgA [Cochlodiniinecator piscidefendens]|uniref:flagellar basal body P-ring formation chaperone FlgA n=1 Tax=Cochlodiniinecator piscidefendens TaxID=2715756 RepID=UPI00140A9BD1|nr:flagellar basal body P-ring formation chaperone FlgA [Cochlodiniinecator piscidefendens]
MKRVLASICFAMMATSVCAEVVVASRTIRSHTMLTEQDLLLNVGEVPGTYTAIEQLIGQESRVVLYAGRPIRSGEVGPAAIIERNQIITLVYNGGGLMIATEGRAMGRAAPGERLRVMNLSSRSTVTGQVAEDGTVYVGQ